LNQGAHSGGCLINKIAEEIAMPAIGSLKSNSIFSSMIAAVCDWARYHIDDCASYEIERMARDVGLSPGELRRMSKLKPDAAKLVMERLAALHLNPETLTKTDPATMLDLQRLCTNCASKRRCQRDLARRPDDPVWRQYCPNEGTLKALQFEALSACCGRKQ
jgi:hypothetical protein